MSAITPVRLALLGCGSIGRRHLENVRAMEGVFLEAAVDVREEAAAVFCREFEGRYHTTDPRYVFDDRNVDAVIICTHHDSHAFLAEQAAQAGKHILLEKPMALTAAECWSISETVAQANVKLSINFKFRFAPAVQQARELIKRPLMTVGHLCMEPLAEGSWVRDPVKGGGLILATACHVLDMVCWLNRSDPAVVYAESVPHQPDQGCNVSAATATLRFANGAIASLAMADAGENPYAGKWLHEVFDGKRSAVLYDHFRQVRFSGVQPEHYQATDSLKEDGTYGVLEDFVGSIREGRVPAISARDGIRATVLALSILKSLRSGLPETVRLDDRH
ncbi:MAG: Gfo/Idh/MocA family oxidoreductase [Acidobacteriota bacterium]